MKKLFIVAVKGLEVMIIWNATTMTHQIEYNPIDARK